MGTYVHFETLHPAQQLVQMITRIYDQGLTSTSGGNLSIRDTNGDIYITPSSIDKGRLTKHDICCVRPSGEIIGPHKPSVELPFHRHVYEVRPDISAIVHAHPPGLVGFSLARTVPSMALFRGMDAQIGRVCSSDYAVPGSALLGDILAKQFEQGYDAIMMENHGVVVGKKDLVSAYMAFEALDGLAQVQFGAASLGPLRTLSPAQCATKTAPHGLSPAKFGPMPATEKELRQELSYLSRRAWTHGLFSAAFGEFSARIDENSFLISPAGLDRAELAPEDFVRVQGDSVASGQTPDANVLLHRAIYRQNPSAQAITLARPSAMMAFATTDAVFDSRTIPESYLMLRFPARLPFGALQGDVNALAGVFSDRVPVAIVENEAFITVGQSPVNAYDRLEVGEYSARSLLNCKAIGKAVSISDEEVADINLHFGID